MAAPVPPTERTIRAFELAGDDVKDCTWAWEDRHSPTKKAIRAEFSNGTVLIIDVHPAVNRKPWTFGGAYIRDVQGSEVNIDAETSADARREITAFINEVFASEITEAAANVNSNSRASQSADWRAKPDGSGQKPTS
ncbi:hypothetical protein ACIRBZ_47610 [Streptomyces sp. NPDC094038]|uniref:hypothetical protein n=1 Tax=Streptomyces sp. NPDC094038 TaxID=3366055 RepID=UPI003805818E